MNVESKVTEALRSFSFSDYGLDLIDEVIRDPELDLLPGLAAHICTYLEDHICTYLEDENRYRKALETILFEVSIPPYTVSGRKAWIRHVCAEALAAEERGQA